MLTSNTNGCLPETDFSDLATYLSDTGDIGSFDAPSDSAPETVVGVEVLDSHREDSIDVQGADDGSWDTSLDTDVIQCEEDENCNDQNPCTEDRCATEGHCKYWKVDSLCDDGIECTMNDYCEEGQCKPGVPADCGAEAIEPCTAWVCDPVYDCIRVPISDGEPCGTGNACSMEPKCFDGVCVAQSSITCDDGVGCTEDKCDPVVGCQSKPSDALCDDENPCTTDACSLVSGCDYVAEDGPCDDKNVCTLNDICEGTLCVGGPTKNCDDDNLCTTDACDPAKGCVYTNLASACDDGNACTGMGSCTDGVCKSQTSVQCNDSNSCTIDACNPTTGCVFTNNNGITCNDGNQCTTNDTCQAGKCSGTAITCSDNNACTTDTCIPAIGCSFQANVGSACNDGNPCTINDKCGSGGTCAGTTSATQCNDGNACTNNDVCASGACAGATIVCNDNNSCTNDTCNPATGCVFTNNAVTCNDGSVCTASDTCNGGACVGAPIVCNDSNICTNDSCNPASGCVFTTNTSACNDGDPCTAGDQCSAGACVPAGVDPSCVPPDVVCEIFGASGSTVICPMLLARKTQQTPLPSALQFELLYDTTKISAVQFQDETCFGANGGPPCANVPVPPNPMYPSSHTFAVAPTPVSAWDGSGEVVAVNTGDPSSPITTAYLGPALAVVGDAEFVEFVVQLKLSISPLSPEYVTAQNIVGATSLAKPMAGEVLDKVMVVSTGGVTCAADPSICNDNNVCTNDLCDVSAGLCVHVPKSGPCDDDSVCTVNDACATGSCTGVSIVCNDNNPCTYDTCIAATGCVFSPNSSSCNDSNACTSSDTCASGVCAGVAITCNDNNVCTNDTCNPASGCVFTNNTSACNDGNACTLNDVCVGGACAGQDSDPLCAPMNAFCEVSGAAGSQVVCPVMLARKTQGTPFPTALQFDILYNTAALSAVQLQDEICIVPDVCFKAPTPPASIQPSGHVVSVNPSPVASWVGTGKVLLANTSDPTSPITTAYLDAALSVVDDPLFMELVVQLKVNIPTSNPEYLTFEYIIGATSVAQPMQGEVISEIMVVSL